MPQTTSTNALLSGLLIVLATSAGAQSAEEGEFNGPDAAKEGGKASLVAATKVDHYGSDGPAVSALPAVEYQWANGWYAGTNRGVGYNFSSHPGLQYGLGLGLDSGRKESAAGALAGMGSIDSKLEYGAFLTYAPDRNVRLTSVVRVGSGDTAQGATASFGANYSLNIAPRWRLDAGVTGTWANAQYMQSYFVVNASQAVQSGNALYSPGSGLRDVSTSLNLNYQLTPKVSVSTGIKATSLLGDAKDSPIVTNPQSLSGSLSIGYAF